ncbi:type IV secretion protein Rhs [Burkholderia cepacia]|uniref:DUF6531 domain-containing protein n=1 Tax=Burkholderia cepacia TaxID=292 RepID=UPI00249F45CE|nr:DUF6531 domain-containing protein [Burkholderia cepacia]WGY72034.1 type IV secretion protein Rhs [Burkholderia cepacia]
MALLAVKHLDPVVGVDVHSVLVTPGTPPVFLPHPHVGFMLDKREYIQAAKAVVGCIATMIAQEKLTQYIEDHPEDVKKLEHLAEEANRQVNELMGGGKLPDTVVEAMKLANEANKIKSRINDDLGSNVGAGGSSGRPIFVNGMMRATAGTHAYHVPGLHFPLGESFAPPPEDVEPSNDGESFMGSKTVLANNDPMSYMALEALSCWSIGMEPPPHNSAHTDRTYPSMPSSVMLPIPAGRPVLVGGPPIMNMAAAAKGLFKAFRGSKWAKALADKLNLKSGFLRCNVLKAEPVDATTGEVVVQQRDFTVPGRLPFVWERHYASNSRYDGVVGTGWQTPADIRLELVIHDGMAGAVARLLDHATAFDTLPPDNRNGWPSRVFDWQYGYALYWQGGALVLRLDTGIEYTFSLPPDWRQRLPALRGDATLKLLVDRMADPSGNAWVFERDARDCLVRITELAHDGPTKRTIECSLAATRHGVPQVANSITRIASLTLSDAGNQSHPLVTYEHDSAGNLCAAVDAMAQPHRFVYANDHRIVKHTSARGVSFYYAYQEGEDGLPCVKRAWGDDGLFDYRFSYNYAAKETTITDSRGNRSTLQLDERRIPVAEIDPRGALTSYRYDAQGRTSARIDPVGRTTAWQYDRHGNLVSQILPDGSTTHTRYNEDHRPVCMTFGGGRQWLYQWDSRGNLLTRIHPSGAIFRHSYDRRGQLVERIGPRGAITRFDYDSDGNLSTQTDALGRCTRYRHDPRGNLVEVVDTLNQHHLFSYDRNGNLIRVTEPGGREIHCLYDPDGNLIRYRDPSAQVTTMEYTALGQVRKRIAADGTVVEYRFDTEEQLIGIVNQRGELYALERNELGQVTKETDYWGQTRHYRYGPSGELIESVDPMGRTVGYLYDRLGRLTEKHTTASEPGRNTQVDRFEYDRNGDLITASNPSCSVSFRYDDDGRVVEERQGGAFTITSDYDIAGNRTERKTRLVADNQIVEHTVRYEYDLSDALTSIEVDGNPLVAIERDEFGRISVEQLGANLRREFAYEPGSRISSQRTLLDTSALFASQYTYDLNGELTDRHDERGTEHFQYDPVGQIVTHTNPAGRLRRFIYDPVGDLLRTRVSERRSAEPVTRPSAWIRDGEFENCYFAFDRAGNLIRKQSTEHELALHWDSTGQLTEAEETRSVNAASKHLSSHVLARYDYDALRRRVRKLVTERDASGSSTTRSSHFFWDAATLVAEYATERGEQGNSKRIATPGESSESHRCFAYEWIYYPTTFRPLAALHQNFSTEQPTFQYETTYFYQTDPNGAAVRMHDSKGNVAWEASYGPTGHAGFFHGRIAQPIRLQGQYFDDESGLHYNWHRYFDPDIGQFVSQDPVGLYGGTHPYKFAPNIFRWGDPWGLVYEQTQITSGSVFRGAGSGQPLFSPTAGDVAHYAQHENMAGISTKPKYNTQAQKFFEKKEADVYEVDVSKLRNLEVWDDGSKKGVHASIMPSSEYLERRKLSMLDVLQEWARNKEGHELTKEISAASTCVVKRSEEA